MNLERLIAALSILTVVFAIGYAGSAATGVRPATARAAIAAPPTPARVAKQLATLEGRLADARQRIDVVLAELADAADDAARDATRARLGVLYRLEAGLQADIARAQVRFADAAR